MVNRPEYNNRLNEAIDAFVSKDPLIDQKELNVPLGIKYDKDNHVDIAVDSTV